MKKVVVIVLVVLCVFGLSGCGEKKSVPGFKVNASVRM